MKYSDCKTVVSDTLTFLVKYSSHSTNRFNICWMGFTIVLRSNKFNICFKFYIKKSFNIRSDQSLSHVRLCDPMNRSTPGLPVQHQLLEFTETHVHRVSDAIQPSHPLSSPSPPAPNPSQHQSLFQWVNSSHEVVKLLEFQQKKRPYYPANPLTKSLCRRDIYTVM